MELELKRRYTKQGTNGTLFHKVCHTIELPWLNNLRNKSCIPEGRYQLQKRYTSKRGYHLILTGIPGRSGILIHPANSALTELLGCIAPVTTCTGNGKGSQSKLATAKLQSLVFEALDRNEKVFLTISKA